MALLRSLSSNQGYITCTYISKLARKCSTTPSVSKDKETKKYTFDESLLEILVCPLSKNKLRFDRANNELICDEINVAYQIVNGIPNLVPQDARMLNTGNSVSTDNHLKSKPSN